MKDSVDFLEGHSVELQDRLATEMREASDKLEFEHAARLRNRIRALASVRAAQGINPSTFNEADVFALHCEGGQSCIQVFFFRAGQNWGNRAYFPRHGAEEQPEEILSALPRAVLRRSRTAEADPQQRRADRSRVAGRSAVPERRMQGRNPPPERGEKTRDRRRGACSTRAKRLGRRMAETGSVAKLLDGVAEVFGAAQRPERIEVYDNSHIQGTNALGAMIVAGPEGFTKNQYRKFNMKTEEFDGDDFAMMKAMIRRRFARMLVEREEQPTSPLAGEVASEASGEGVRRTAP